MLLPKADQRNKEKLSNSVVLLERKRRGWIGCIFAFLVYIIFIDLYICLFSINRDPYSRWLEVRVARSF